MRYGRKIIGFDAVNYEFKNMTPNSASSLKSRMASGLY
jgi:hypothetical protein